MGAEIGTLRDHAAYSYYLCEADVTFSEIVTVAETLPALLAEVDGLEANLSALRLGHAEQIEKTDVLEAENKRLREALECIADKHVGDMPASVNHTEAEWVWKHIRDVRHMARAALKEQQS